MNEPLPYDLDKVLSALLRVGWRIKIQTRRRLVLERKGYEDYEVPAWLPLGWGITSNGIPVQLSHQRWAHIIEGHPEIVSYYYQILEAIRQPDRLYLSNSGDFITVCSVASEKWLVVVYRSSTLDMERAFFSEIEEASFVVTAYLARSICPLDKRQRIL